MMLIKATLMAALLGAALGDQQYTHYDPVQHNFGVRQSGEIDPVVMSVGVGVLNAGYTTLVGLQNAAKNRDTCNKINDILNVGDLAAQTLVQGDAASNAQLASTQTAITAIVNKINEMLQKSTLSC